VPMARGGAALWPRAALDVGAAWPNPCAQRAAQSNLPVDQKTITDGANLVVKEAGDLVTTVTPAATKVRPQQGLRHAQHSQASLGPTRTCRAPFAPPPAR
jgi:hypothetical protein